MPRRRAVARLRNKITDMDKLKKIFMILSFVFICVGFAASVWLYTVLHDETSILIMAVMFVGLVWFGYNLCGMFKEK